MLDVLEKRQFLPPYSPPYERDSYVLLLARGVGVAIFQKKWKTDWIRTLVRCTVTNVVVLRRTGMEAVKACGYDEVRLIQKELQKCPLQLHQLIVSTRSRRSVNS